MTFPKPQVAWTFQTLNGQSCMTTTSQTNRFGSASKSHWGKLIWAWESCIPRDTLVTKDWGMCVREKQMWKRTVSRPQVVGVQPAFLPLESLTQCSISRRVKIFTSLRLARPETPPLCAPGPALALTSLLPFHLPHADPALAGSGFAPNASLFSLAIAYPVRWGQEVGGAASGCHRQGP